MLAVCGKGKREENYAALGYDIRAVFQRAVRIEYVMTYPDDFGVKPFIDKGKESGNCSFVAAENCYFHFCHSFDLNLLYFIRNARVVLTAASLIAAHVILLSAEKRAENGQSYNYKMINKAFADAEG